MKIDDITQEQLETLRSEAAAAGDTDMVRIVDDALESDCEDTQAAALEQCAAAMQSAADARDES